MQLITYWEVEMPPFRRKRTLTQINTLMNVSRDQHACGQLYISFFICFIWQRTPLQPEIAASIHLPVLIIQVGKAFASSLILTNFYVERAIRNLSVEIRRKIGGRPGQCGRGRHLVYSQRFHSAWTGFIGVSCLCRELLQVPPGV